MLQLTKALHKIKVLNSWHLISSEMFITLIERLLFLNAVMEIYLCKHDVSNDSNHHPNMGLLVIVATFLP